MAGASAERGQGKWWKELREKAKYFEGDPDIVGSGVARSEFISSNNLLDEQVVNQVTIKVDGIDEQIRIDYFGQSQDGKFHLGDAKFSTKDKNWAAEWQSASTEHQKIVFPSMKGKDIYIKASDPVKLEAIRLAFDIDPTEFINGAYRISADKIGSLKIFGSAADDANVVKDIINVF